MELVKQAQEFIAIDYSADMINALILVWKLRGSFGNIWKYGVELSKSFLSNATHNEINSTLTNILKAFSYPGQFPKAQNAWNEFVVNRRVVPDAITTACYMRLIAGNQSALAALDFAKPYLEKPYASIFKFPTPFDPRRRNHHLFLELEFPSMLCNH
jgi:hypothetical protein